MIVLTNSIQTKKFVGFFHINKTGKFNFVLHKSDMPKGKKVTHVSFGIFFIHTISVIKKINYPTFGSFNPITI